ncbi:MAG TPA: hypothetical protein VJN18_35760 [Polyangiaceae bacterium]|nr:hypothetical protein [Polyangiaceae bacterium]
MSLPDRKPDAHELMTTAQVNEALLEWLGKHRNLEGQFAVCLVATTVLNREESRVEIKLWRDP